MKARKSIIALTSILLALSVCLFAFASCSKDEEVTIVDISFSTDAVSLAEGQRLVAGDPSLLNVTLSNGKEYKDRYGGLVWEESSDGKIISHDHGGIFDGISYGDATVICYSADDPSISAAIDVRVNRDDKLRVGVKDDVYNFGYYNNYLEFEGMEIDLADRIGYELYFNEVEYVSLEADEREEALSNGLAEREAEKEALEQEESAADAESADANEGYKAVDCVIATYSVTDERRWEVEFSDVYYTDYVQVMVRKDYEQRFASYDSTESGTPSLADMFFYLDKEAEREKVAVGTVEGTTAWQAFNTYVSGLTMRDNGDGTTTTYQKNYESKTYRSYADCANALLSGEIQAFCGDHSILNGYMSGDTMLMFLYDAFSPQNYAVGTAIGSDFTEPINSLISDWLTVEDCADEDGNPCTYIAWLLEKWGIENFDDYEEA